jgi:hypothetical protein
VTFDLPPIRTAADLAEAQEAIAQQVAEGTLTPGEGVQVAALIEARRKTIESQDLEARIAALEAAAGGKQP